MKFILFFIFCVPIFGHWHEAYYYEASDFNPLLKQMGTHFTHLSNINDDTNVLDVDYLGSHDSGTYKMQTLFVSTQVLDIYQQLEYGVRFLDVRLRHTEKSFALHHGPVFLQLMFGDVLNQVITFLNNYPDEYVFIGLQREQEALNPQGTLCEVLDKYIEDWGGNKYFYKGSYNNLKVKDVRGKIILVGQAYFNYCPITFDFNNCNKQMDWDLSTNWDLYDKWLKVKNFATSFKSPNNDAICGINFLGGSSSTLGVRPEFVVSGHIFADTGANRLSTGLVDPFFKSYPDFPRTDCFLGMCTIAFEGTNILHDEKLGDKITQYGSYVLITDYMGTRQMKTIIQNNKNRQKLVRNSRNICVETCNGSCTYVLEDYIKLDDEMCEYTYKIKNCTSVTCINSLCEKTTDTSKYRKRQLAKCKRFASFTNETRYLPTYPIPSYGGTFVYKYPQEANNFTLLKKEVYKLVDDYELFKSIV